MNKFEFCINFVRLRLGIIVDKSVFRASVFSDITVSKPESEPLLYLTIESNGQRLEVHPSSIGEVIKVEDEEIYFLMLLRRPTMKSIEASKDYWNQDILEFNNEDPYLALIIPHFLVIRLEFTEKPHDFHKYLEKMKIQLCLGFFTETTSKDYPIKLTRRFWMVPWEIKYSIFMLLTNRKMTIDDLTEDNLKLLSSIENSEFMLENLFFYNKNFSIEALQEVAYIEKNTNIIPEGHISIRKIMISPNCIIFMPHEIDLGNRAVRDKDPDYFLRVNFVDEYNDRSVWNRCPRVLNRFKKLLRGFSVLGRYFEFLGFSNSQMRNHSCWLLSPNIEFNGDTLRNSFGNFDKITSVCKYASRLGLCFSGTHGTINIPEDKVFQIDDIKHNGFTFSDGIGLISKDLFDKVLRSVYVKENQKVSALQIRICGCKGVLAVDPIIETGVYVRPSMNKFVSTHSRLELCTYAVGHPGYLNRQLILILNGLGVKTSVFQDLQNKMIDELRSTLASEEAARDFLNKTYPSYYKDIIYMLDHGVKLVHDAYLKGMINAYFLANFKLIKSKARIFAPESKLLMGVLDEYRVLEYGEVFIQITEDNSSYVVESEIAIGKNPCYHPGDIRVLRAVSKPQLMHLHNVVVFPQIGPRPHPNECSGSDLDGDLYFVTWNKELIPERQVDAMDYIAPDELMDQNPSMIEKVIDFFATFMASENIGRISNAHLIWADSKGIFSEEALKLAHLTSVAVDFPKTGRPAELPMKLKISRWPDFMEKANKQSYPSQGVIGVLWRDCVFEKIDMKISKVVNKNWLVQGYEEYLGFAKYMHNIYAGKMQKLVHQYDAQSEFFLITGQSGENSRRKMKYDDDVQIQNLVSCYKEEVFKIFCAKSHDMIERRKIASACYYLVYSKKKNVFLSFPWIFYEYLIS